MYKSRNNLFDRFVMYIKKQDMQKRDDENDMWLKITDEIAMIEKRIVRQKQKRRFYLTVSSIAACSLLFLYIGLNKYNSDEDINSLDSYVSNLSELKNTSKDIQLLLSDNRSVVVNKDSVDISYSSEGKVQINKDPKSSMQPQKDGIEKDNYNQIVVPRGKYTHLTLSDGTQMHINSGTRVVYPRVFTGKQREIYVEGEVYLDVTPNKKKPFVVKTKQCDVRVMGTSFNVNACDYNSSVEVVLVEGSVKLLDKQNHEILLKPDNLVAVKNGSAGKIRRVRAKDYTAWIDGLLILHNEPLKSVCDKLERFFDTPIVVNPNIELEIVDGKLDLSLPLSELIRMISIASSVDYKQNNGTFYMMEKNK